MPGPTTTSGWGNARVCAVLHFTFRSLDNVGARDNTLSRLNGLHAPLPTLRRYPRGYLRTAHIVMDFHHLLLAGLPAHPT
jgi:hypothetical protein